MEDRKALHLESPNEPKRLFDYCERNKSVAVDSVCFIRRNNDHVLRSLTWRELHEEVLKVAELLGNCHVTPQSRVVNTAANSLEWILMELACSCLNAVHVPLDPRLPREQIISIIQDIKPVLALVDNDGQLGSMSPSVGSFSCSRIRDFIDQSDRLSTADSHRIVSKPHDGDIANILFTSGTTSTPKGVMLTHRNLVRNAMAKLDAMPQFQSDHRLNLLPFSHAYAKTCELATWLISASSLEIASNAGELIDKFAIARPTLFNGVPIVFKRIYTEWCRCGSSPETLRRLTGGRMRQFASGGAPIHDQLRDAFENAGLPILQGYGLTEAGPVVCSNRSGVNNKGSDRCLVGVGPAVKGVELKIDSERRLWVRGDGVMLGYWNDPQSTSDRIKDGWLDTGDVAEFDKSQNVRILGRSDDTIILDNGYKIDPLAIEHLICSIKGVKDCALVTNDLSGYDIALLCDDIGESLSSTEYEIAITALLRKNLIVLPKRIVLATQDWSESNGFRNLKGAKNREKIKQWVWEVRDNL